MAAGPIVRDESSSVARASFGDSRSRSGLKRGHPSKADALGANELAMAIRTLIHAISTFLPSTGRSGQVVEGHSKAPLQRIGA